MTSRARLEAPAVDEAIRRVLAAERSADAAVREGRATADALVESGRAQARAIAARAERRLRALRQRVEARTNEAVAAIEATDRDVPPGAAARLDERVVSHAVRAVAAELAGGAP